MLVENKQTNETTTTTKQTNSNRLVRIDERPVLLFCLCRLVQGIPDKAQNVTGKAYFIIIFLNLKQY